jgi:hypothetical protein
LTAHRVEGFKMSDADTNKADRKLAATAAGDMGKRGTYEDTPFGGRRISNIPNWLRTLCRLAATSILFISRRLRRSPPPP